MAFDWRSVVQVHQRLVRSEQARAAEEGQMQRAFVAMEGWKKLGG